MYTSLNPLLPELFVGLDRNSVRMEWDISGTLGGRGLTSIGTEVVEK